MNRELIVTINNNKKILEGYISDIKSALDDKNNDLSQEERQQALDDLINYERELSNVTSDLDDYKNDNSLENELCKKYNVKSKKNKSFNKFKSFKSKSKEKNTVSSDEIKSNDIPNKKVSRRKINLEDYDKINLVKYTREELYNFQMYFYKVDSYLRKKYYMKKANNGSKEIIAELRSLILEIDKKYNEVRDELIRKNEEFIRINDIKMNDKILDLKK